jgi:hypothetical protein
MTKTWGIALVIFMSLASSQGARAGASRSLTLDERVAAQRAIEEVYWRHRIWPKDNPNPKPSLDVTMPRA